MEAVRSSFFLPNRHHHCYWDHCTRVIQLDLLTLDCPTVIVLPSMSVKELEARFEKISVVDLDLQKEVLTVHDPLARLPLEISSEIFLQCLPPLPEPGARHVPMLFLNICTAWTTIALSTPALWAAIHIIFPRHIDFKEVLKTWLQRAHNSPLSVSIHGSFNNDIAAIISQYSQQLKNLHICHDGANVSVGDEDSVEEIHHLLGGICAESYPSLERAVFCGSSDDRWAQSCREILQLLRLSPNLTDCIFHHMYPVFGVPDTEQMVFPSLRRLVFGESKTGVGSDDEILKCLSLPNLQTLHLPLDEVSDADLISFLQRSAPPLQSLKLGDVHDSLPLRFAQLEECVRLVPTLEELELLRPNESLMDDLLESLAESPSHILPNLRSLIIHGFFSRVLWHTLLRVLSGRRSHLACFKIIIEQDDWIILEQDVWLPHAGTDLRAAFRELVEDGMQIYVGTEDRTRSILFV
ncbi:hypothetical protein DFH07DRAFT_561280 [Mycena maculata]|uniref:F-box domain-containing protein n=1 Tax=Mycena maculata TaxID=230809 RepID=A0AAD7ISL4_9AGAR|nr:hypothetical protein DFH07DRAFT_561280 [Mycena maculata]